MTTTQTHGTSEEGLTRIEYRLAIYRELLRLRHREADLTTALNLQEGLYRELQQENIILKDQLCEAQQELEWEMTDLPPVDHPLPSFLSQAPEGDHGEYARGVRV